jgi:glycosyltransferase involved in cell wall biosynthesis
MHLITSLSIGGAETTLLKLVQRLNREDFNNHVVCLTSKGAIGDEIRRSGVDVSYLNMPSGRLSLKGIIEFIRLVRAFQPDILQSWLYHSDLIGLIIGKILSIKTIIWNLRCAFIDLDRYRISTKIVLKLCVLLSSMPNSIISNSEEAIRYHKILGYRNASWYLIPNGVDTLKFFPDKNAKQALMLELGIPSDRKFKNAKSHEDILLVGCVARFDPMKDFETLIEAAKIVIEKFDNVRFILVGRNVEWQNPFFKHSIPDNMCSRFFLMGERRDIPRIMAALDIFVLTSYGEGFPNALCEAMASAVPCIATDVGDCKSIIGNTGFIVEAQNPTKISKAISDLVRATPKKRKEMGNEARQRVLARYTITSVAQMYEYLYKSLGSYASSY